MRYSLSALIVIVTVGEIDEQGTTPWRTRAEAMKSLQSIEKLIFWVPECALIP